MNIIESDFYKSLSDKEKQVLDLLYKFKNSIVSNQNIDAIFWWKDLSYPDKAAIIMPKTALKYTFILARLLLHKTIVLNY